jgi:site-specific DNA recombinase
MNQTLGSSPAKRILRCAIYTRKSTEEGLEKEFNSLDAQREAAEAFIKSQAHENWTCLPQRYDDGGFTGGTMERPALAQLLADIQANRIDIVVTYKVDRLSRSLLDFARMMAVFDQHGVSFVAVTQQFNTATSMGRLVLNVLLSFAQFEREIIGERTRDKIAAARRKGKWVGMLPPLGYTVDPRSPKLQIDEAEAERVRAIFNLYLERQALLPVVEELEQRGWTTKRWQTRKGHYRGGQRFTTTRLYQLLIQPAYVGKVRYKTELHKGEHQGIVDPSVWQRVQDLLHHNGPGRNQGPRVPSGALLQGLLRCQPCGMAMTPNYASPRNAIRYRYYICLNATKRGRQHCPSKSVSAPAIEQFVVQQLQGLASSPTTSVEDRAALAPIADLASWQALPMPEQAQSLKALLRRIDYDGSSGQITLHFQPSTPCEIQV